MLIFQFLPSKERRCCAVRRVEQMLQLERKYRLRLPKLGVRSLHRRGFRFVRRGWQQGEIKMLHNKKQRKFCAFKSVPSLISTQALRFHLKKFYA